MNNELSISQLKKIDSLEQILKMLNYEYVNMYEISRKQEKSVVKWFFPARLHVRDITENVVGLDLAEMGCRIKSKYRFNILSKIILEFYIPSREEGKYVVGDPMGNVIVRWTKPSKQRGYFILGLEFGSKPRENHGVTELLGGPRSQTAKQLKCQNKSLMGHYAECFACGQKYPTIFVKK